MTKIKTLPKFMTKARLVTLYIDQYPKLWIIRMINEIILSNPTRELDRTKTPRVKKLTNWETKKFIETADWPTGYGPESE